MVEFIIKEPTFLRPPVHCIDSATKADTSRVNIPSTASPVSFNPTDAKACLPKLQSLDELIFHLREEMGGFGLDSNTVNPKRIIQLMGSYSSCAIDWKKYAHFNSRNYTRNLVDSGNGKFNLLVLAWGPGQASPIHDHSDAHCIMKILDGELQETVFLWPDSSSLNPLYPTHTTTFRMNQVAYMHDELGLHRMANNSSANALSLHLYSPPISHATIFHPTTGQATRSACSLYSAHGEKYPS
ncbi:hypothetical protein DSO57_1021148 [Entomophthora muscae]|uniref:Uncharacterized protein n=1 Tax=Entomophthora muscae TaxID=34485 RepID=A0ACC2RUP8_9FUNG|nr:hypothetical protein DSO57_1021148 [Entomophthora muscae]